MPLSLFSAFSLVICTAFPVFAAAKNDDSASGQSVIREMNLARQNPALYATFIQKLRSRMNGNLLVLPGRTRIHTREGTAAVDEAIRFLKSAQQLPPLTLSRGMSRAAADHCADQANGDSVTKDAIAAMPANGSRATELSAAVGAKTFPTANRAP